MNENERYVRNLIWKGLRYFYGKDYVRMPCCETYLHETPERLEREQVRQGVRAMLFSLGIFHSGNSAGRDLYALVELYLLNPEATQALNEVLAKMGRPVI